MIRPVCRGVPFHWITEFAVKPVPLTVSVVSGDPVKIVLGETAVICVPGCVAVATLRLTAAEVPPPGVGFTAVSERLPAAARSAAVRVTPTWVALVNVVVRDVLPTLITVAGSNPVPVTTTTADDIPAVSPVGEIDVIVGTGLSTSRLTAVPALLTVPFTTVTAT